MGHSAMLHLRSSGRAILTFIAQGFTLEVSRQLLRLYQADFSKPGAPTHNALSTAFNRRFRTERSLFCEHELGGFTNKIPSIQLQAYPLE
jgi:hypothetical protein